MSYPIPGADSDHLQYLAQRYQMLLSVGIIERFNASTLYNSALLIDATGEILIHHRKIKVVSTDPAYTPGPAVPSNVMAVNTSCCGVVGVLICADVHREDVVVCKFIRKQSYTRTVSASRSRFPCCQKVVSFFRLQFFFFFSVYTFFLLSPSPSLCVPPFMYFSFLFPSVALFFSLPFSTLVLWISLSLFLSAPFCSSYRSSLFLHILPRI